MDAITATRRQLDALMAELEGDRKALAAEQAAVAAATEHLSQDAAVRAAWQQGGQAMRGRILLLIDQQLSALGRAGMNRGLLTALRRQVEGEEHG
jgi:hypothetical protein